MASTEHNDEMLETLLSYKKMASDECNHSLMMKDKTMVQFLAYSLDSTDFDVVDAALQTIALLANNFKNQSTLKATFGINEALTATSERADLEKPLKQLATHILSKLNQMSPTLKPRSRSKSSMHSTSNLISIVYTFQVFGLNEDTRLDLENTLIRINGVISVVVDVEHQRCTVRVNEKLSASTLAENIRNKTKLEARLIMRNSKNQEVLKDVLETKQGDFIDNLPPYLEEEEYPVNEKAVSLGKLTTNASSWARSIASFLQNSLYW